MRPRIYVSGCSYIGPSVGNAFFRMHEIASPLYVLLFRSVFSGNGQAVRPSICLYDHPSVRPNANVDHSVLFVPFLLFSLFLFLAIETCSSLYNHRIPHTTSCHILDATFDSSLSNNIFCFPS